MTHTTITVVIPTKNREQDLISACESVINQTRVPDEIVIVDQSDTEDCKVAIQNLFTNHPRPKMHYVWNNKIGGTAAAKNRAAQLASGDLLVFMDDDVVLDRECLASILQVHEQNELDGIGGIAIPNLRRGAIYDLASALFHLGPFCDERLFVQQGRRKLKELYPTRILSTCLASFKKCIFDDYQFDETLVGHSLGEDVDFCHRVSQKFRFAIAPTVRGIHNLSKENRLGLRNLYRAKCQFYSFFFRKNIVKTLPNVLAYLWVNLGLMLDALAKAISKQSLAPVLGILGGWREVFWEMRK